MITWILSQLKQKVMGDAEKRHQISIAGIEEMLTSLDAPAMPDVSYIQQPEYHPYRSLYRRATSILNRLGVQFEYDIIRTKVGIGTMWIKTIDDLIDKGNFELADQAVERFNNPEVHYDEKTAKHPIHFLTEAVKQVVEPERYELVISKFIKVYRFVRDSHHKKFPSLIEFLGYRLQEANLVSEAGYIGIEQNLIKNGEKFREFLIVANIFGTYFDTLLDIREDVEAELYPEPN